MDGLCVSLQLSVLLTTMLLLILCDHSLQLSAADNSTLSAKSFYVFEIKGKPDDGYYVSIQLGTPPKTFNVVLDTGSSNFAIAAYNDTFVTSYYSPNKSSSFQSADSNLTANYTEGSWSGYLGSDVARFPSSQELSTRVNIALITRSNSFFVNSSNWQGILGIGYHDLALGKDKPMDFLDSFVLADLIQDSFSLLLCAPKDSNITDDVGTGGKFTLGGLDSTQYKHELYRAKVVKMDYYRVLLTDIRVDGESLDLDCVEYNTDKTIVDSGTTNFALPQKVFDKFISTMKKKIKRHPLIKVSDKFWSGVDPICLPRPLMQAEGNIYTLFPVIALDLYSSEKHILTLTVPPQQYLRPVGLDHRGYDCFSFAVSRTNSGSVIGAVIMEGFFVYFDRENATVSFADTTCEPRDAFSLFSSVSGYSTALHATLDSCQYKLKTNHLPAYVIALAAIGSFLFVIFITFITVKCIRNRRKRHARLQEEVDYHDLVDHTFDTDY